MGGQEYYYERGEERGGGHIMIELNPLVIFFAAIFTNNMIFSYFRHVFLYLSIQ